MKLFPKTDLESLRGWLDKRAASLKKEREPHEGFWRTLAEHYEPDLGRAIGDDDEDIENRAAAPRDAKIMNSTPRTELRRAASAMKSGTANESRQWFRLRVKEQQDDAQAENPVWTQWLDKLTRGMAALLDQSNAYGSIGKLFLHTMLFGGGAAVVAGNHPDDVIDVRVIDTGAFWIGSTRGGRVDVLMRRVSMTAREIMEEFGEHRCPADAERACETGADERRVKLWNLICPNKGERFPDLNEKMLFASVWWTDAKSDCGGEVTAGVVDIRGYTYNPILCPRWDVFDGVYGTGPGRIGLPDVLMLYRLENDSLKGIAQRVDPPLAAPESMEGRAVNTYPGGVTYYPEQNGRDRSLHALIDQPPDVQAVEMKISQVESRLRRVFYADLFNAILNVANTSNTQMTARQVEEMSGEKISLLGPVLTNLNHGLFDPLISAVFGVMLERDLVPEPPESLQGVEFQAEYVSTLHMRQQEEARLGGIMRFSQFAAGILQVSPDSALKIDFDQMLDEAALALAVPGSVIRSDKDVGRIREQRAADAQAQQQAAVMAETGRQAPGYADAAKTLSETPVGGTNALEALVGAAQRTNGGMM